MTPHDEQVAPQRAALAPDSRDARQVPAGRAEVVEHALGFVVNSLLDGSRAEEWINAPVRFEKGQRKRDVLELCSDRATGDCGATGHELSPNPLRIQRANNDLVDRRLSFPIILSPSSDGMQANLHVKGRLAQNRADSDIIAVRNEKPSRSTQVIHILTDSRSPEVAA